MKLNCQICRIALNNGTRSNAHKSLCKGCYSDVVRYTRYVKLTSRDLKQRIFVKRMNNKFTMNDLDDSYVPKSYYQYGRGLNEV